MKALRSGLLASSCALALALVPALASAQQIPDQAYRPTGQLAQTNPVVVISTDSVSGQPCVAGSSPTCLLSSGGSSNAAPWAKDSATAVILTPGTGTSTATHLTGTGTVVSVENTSSTGVDAYVLTSASSGVQAATTDVVVHPGQVAALPNLGYISAITASGTGALRITTGTGDPRPAFSAGFNSPSVVAGSVAAGAAPVDNPLADGCRAKTALPTAVSDATAQYLLCDKYGRVISPSILRENKGIQQTDVSGTSETTIVTADASNKLELYCLVLSNTNTSNVATATIKDATAGTTRGKFEIPAGDTRGFCGPADSGWPQAALNNNWTVTLAGTSPTVSVTALYLKSGS